MGCDGAKTNLKQLEETVQNVRAVLKNWPESRLLETRRIQGFEETVLSAICHCINHLAGHTQEIIHMTRVQLGDAYQFAWRP